MEFRACVFAHEKEKVLGASHTILAMITTSISTPKLRCLAKLYENEDDNKENSPIPKIASYEVQRLKDELVEEKTKRENELSELRLKHNQHIQHLTVQSRETSVELIRNAQQEQQRQHDRHLAELNRRWSEKLEKARKQMNEETVSKINLLQKDQEVRKADFDKAQMMSTALSMSRTQIISLKNKLNKTATELEEKKNRVGELERQLGDQQSIGMRVSTNAKTVIMAAKKCRKVPKEMTHVDYTLLAILFSLFTIILFPM